MNAKKQMQLAARLDYLDERLARIKSSLDVYSQSTIKYVAASWTKEDDSKMSENLNGCISAAQNFLLKASEYPFEKPQAMTIVPVIHSGSRDVLNDQDASLEF